MNGDNPNSPQASGNWQFSPTGSNTDAQPSGESTQPAATPSDQHAEAHQGSPEDEVNWTASEFIAHEKSLNWYLVLAASVLFFTALVFFATRDKITTAVIILAAIIFGVYAARKPRTLSYRLGSAGLLVGEKFYDFNQFRSFVVFHEGVFSSISFMPLKRFMPILTVYYSPEDEQRIMQLLSLRLPMENHGRDAIDRFLHRIRF
jgi:hypothetical protein